MGVFEKQKKSKTSALMKSIIDHFYWHFIDVFQGAKGPQFRESGHFA